LKNGKWENAKVDAAFLAHFVAEAHDPFNTTENYDGTPAVKMASINDSTPF